MKKNSGINLKKELITLSKYSFGIVIIFDIIYYITKTLSIYRKRKKTKEKINYINLKNLFFENTIPRFFFLFGQLVTTNLIINIFQKKKIKNFSKFIFLIGFSISYFFIKKIKIKIPETLSFYILARIGMLYIKKLQKNKIINKNFPIMKTIFIFLITFLTYYIVNFPEYVNKKIVSNYKRIGGFTERGWIDMKNTSKEFRRRNL